MHMNVYIIYYMYKEYSQLTTFEQNNDTKNEIYRMKIILEIEFK